MNDTNPDAEPPPENNPAGERRIPPPTIRPTPQPEVTPPAPATAKAPAPAPVDETPVEASPEAPLGSRIGGFAIDIVIAMGLSFIGGIINNSLGSLLSLAYIVLRDCLPFLNGQSIGKTVMKTRAVTEDGVSLSGNWNNGVLRNLVLLIPFFALVELIVLITRKDQPRLRRLGDDWFQTKVVSVAPETTPAVAVAPPAA